MSRHVFDSRQRARLSIEAKRLEAVDGDLRSERLSQLAIQQDIATRSMNQEKYRFAGAWLNRNQSVPVLLAGRPGGKVHGKELHRGRGKEARQRQTMTKLLLDSVHQANGQQ